MRRLSHTLLLLFFLLACAYNSSANSNDTTTIHQLGRDFNEPKAVELELRRELDIIASSYPFAVDGDILWIMGEVDGEYGACYDINTGEYLARVANKGRARNEFISPIRNFTLSDKYIHIDEVVVSNGIKSFLREDIIKNKATNERYLKITHLSDLVNNTLSRYVLLSDGGVLRTNPYLTFEEFCGSSKYVEGGRKERFIIERDGELKYFGKRPDNNIEFISSREMMTKPWPVKFGASVSVKDKRILEKSAYYTLYSNNITTASHNNKVVVVGKNGLNIDIVDTDKCQVERSRYYSKFIYSEDWFYGYASLPMLVHQVKCNDNFICLYVTYMIADEDYSNKWKYKDHLLVFDWELNPIKQFDLPDKIRDLCKDPRNIESASDFWFAISEDCSSIFFIKSYHNNIHLYEAKLEF